METTAKTGLRQRGIERRGGVILTLDDQRSSSILRAPRDTLLDVVYVARSVSISSTPADNRTSLRDLEGTV